MMKTKHLLLPLLASGALAFPAWGNPAARLIQNEPGKTPQPEAEVEAKAEAPFNLVEMAEKLGFAAHLPKNTEGYFSLIGGFDMLTRFLETEAGKFTLEMLTGSTELPNELETEEDFVMLKGILGEEVFIAFGDETGERTIHLNALNASSNFYQMKTLVKMFTTDFGEDADPEDIQDDFTGILADIFGDPEAGLTTFEKMKIPAFTLGFKVSDAEQRGQLSELINGFLMSAMDLDIPLEGVNEKKGDLQLTGLSFSGEKLLETLDENDRAQMGEVFPSKESEERFLKALEAKSAHLVTAVKGEYIILYLGDTLEGLQVTENLEDSLLANPELDFLGQYEEKDIRFFGFIEEEASRQFAQDGELFASMARGLASGLHETDELGDTRDVQALLNHVAELENAIFKMSESGRFGLLAFLEEGFKLESHSGGNYAMLDTEKSHRFSALGGMEDLFYYSNSRTNPDYTAKLLGLVESLGQATYLLVDRLSEHENNLFGLFDLFGLSEELTLLDEFISADLKGLWTALTVDWAQGTGDEGAFVIDTRGTLPRLPGVPAALIEKGRMPRIAYVTPVTDRTKIGAAWGKIEKAIEGILKTVQEMDGPEIPMQEIDDNTKDGITYYSTAVQFSTKDARPVVGLTDQHFYLATSQNLIAEIEAALATAAAPEQKGSFSRLNFQALHELAQHWVTLLKENSAEIYETDEEKEEFEADLLIIEKGLEAFQGLQEMTSRVWKEDGEFRSSLHFKMK